MSQEKNDFKYPLIEKNSKKNIRNITCRVDDETKEDEQMLLREGVELASHYRSAIREVIAEQKAQLAAKLKKNKSA